MRRPEACQLALIPILLLFACSPPPSQEEGSSPDAFPTLSGPYLGQAPALAEPTVFAPGIVSTGFGERDVAIMPDGSEIYWAVVGGGYDWTTVLFSRLEDGRWTEPTTAPCCVDPEYMHLEPHITPDGMHFMWLSNRPGPGPNNGGQEIWVMDREGDGWGQPYPLPEIINTADSEYFPSVTRDGTLYFTRSPAGGGENRIWRSRILDGEYQEPELLPEEVNAGRSRFNAFVDPDERYLILGIVGMEDTVGGTDYYIVFRSEDDLWSDPVNLGPRVNTEGGFEYSPFVSPDGRFFFFMSLRVDWDRVAPGGAFDGSALREIAGEPENGEWDIYWMDAAFLEALRPEGF